jgi:hypothetical protein
MERHQSPLEAHRTQHAGRTDQYLLLLRINHQKEKEINEPAEMLLQSAMQRHRF